MAGGYDLSGYVTVNERLRRALEQWPELRVQETAPKLVTAGDAVFVEVTTTVWRNPDDPLPAIATCWEPFPGTTPYTRGSEQQNASTSALGRVLGLMGVAIDAGMASQDEIRTAQNRGNAPSGTETPPRAEAGSRAQRGPSGGRPPTEKMVAYVRKLAREAGDTITDAEIAEMTGADVSQLIDTYLGKA